MQLGFTHRESFLGVSVTEALYVVKDEPSERDDHEHNEGDGHEEHRCLVDAGVLRDLVSSHGDLHVHTSAVIHQSRYSLPIHLADENRHHVVNCKTETTMYKADNDVDGFLGVYVFDKASPEPIQGRLPRVV